MAQTGEQRKSGGYSAPDNVARCIKCSVGVSNDGRNIGAPIARRDISCQMAPGRSVLVATIGQCTKEMNEFRNGVLLPDCNALYNFKMEPDGLRLGLSKRNVLNCIRHSNGNNFELKELQCGQCVFVDSPETVKPDITVKTEKPYDPNQYTEQAIDDVPF